MYLTKSNLNHCSECETLLEVMFQFKKIPPPHPGWRTFEVFYLLCPSCGKFYIGDHATGIRGGSCWGRSPIDKVHQIEGGHSEEAYWLYHTESVAECEVEFKGELDIETI